MNLKYIHNTTIDILKVIDAICQKHNLSYFLMYGSLIGAIRHKGFIPWDDDLDIAMLRDDYERFLKIAAKELPSNFTICDSNIDHRYTNIFAKVFKTDTRYSSEFFAKNLGINGIWVDIFPVDFIKAKDENHACNIISKRFSIIMFLRLILENRNSINPTLSSKMKFICAFCKFLPESLFRRIIHKTFTLNNRQQATFCVVYGGDFEKSLNTLSDFLPTQKSAFENEYFFIPNNPETILARMYGNYLTLPPEEERHPSHDLILNEEN